VAHRILEDYDVYAACKYLQADERLAIVASSVENSPYTVLECLAVGIPFLASDVGGVSELIAGEDHAGTLFRREEKELRDLIGSALDNGIVPAKPAVSIAQNREAWKEWHASLVPGALFHPAVVNGAPLVSVCMSTFNRPELCAFALKSIERQTYGRVEVVLVDDASPSPHAREFVRQLLPDFKQRGWKVIQNEEELWTGKARNVAVQNSSGDFVLLMDDDNVAKEQEVETLVRAALMSDAHIVTCQQQPFAGTGPAPSFDAERPIGFMPIGPNLPQALYENCLGDLNMLVRRQVWDELGGFTEEKCGCEDYEFLVRAVLKGYRLECVPELLFFYRISGGALAKRYDETALYQAFMRVLRPFRELIPKEFELGMVFAVTARRHAERMAGHGYWGRDR